jgi:hypothetical protein
VSGSDEMPPSPFEVLNFLCVTLARKPPVVSLRQGAAVARYLDDLVYELGAGPDRQRILRLSQVIWGKVFQFSKFKTATKEEAIEFLEDFRLTHLATYNVEAAVKTVSSAKVLKRHVYPTVLRSPGQSITLGSSMGRYSDDLSERICAGYWVLRLAGIHGAREHVAKALNHHGIRTRSPKAGGTWTGFEVNERVKQYEARCFAKRERDIARQVLVGKWSRVVYYPIKVLSPYKPKDDSDLPQNAIEPPLK